MGLFDIDRFKESNDLCRLDEGRKRDGLIHRLYKQDMARIEPAIRMAISGRPAANCATVIGIAGQRLQSDELAARA
jgi:hypothetical protein